MSGSLIRHTPGAVGAHTGGGAASTAGASFERRPYTWDDLPESVRALHAGRGVIAEGAHLQSGELRTPAGLVQVMTAWRAWATQLTVITRHRALMPLPEGRFTTDENPWRVVETRTPELAGPARRTQATVPAGVTATTTLDASVDLGRVPLAHEHAAFVATFLPAPVRATVLAAVPTPELWVGDLVQYDDGEQRLSMLRMGATAAVAVTATRTGRGDVHTLPWTVTQVVYALGGAPQIGRR